MRKGSFAALFATMCAASNALAGGVAVRLDLVSPGAIKLDGLPREWPSAMAPLDERVAGSASGADLGARAAVAYDDANVYVAFDVTDDKLVRTARCAESEDHASIVLAFPNGSGGYASHEVDLYAGDPGKVAGCVKAKGGGAIAGAKLVEAPKPAPGGYTFEAQIPWSAFPEAARTRVGLRGALRYHDTDGGPIDAVVGTATDVAPQDLPRFPVESEQALDDGLLRDKGIVAPPLYDRIGDVAGDAMNERLLVYDRWLVVLGPHYRDGKEYYFTDLGVDARAALPRFEVRDLTGDGKAEILLEKKVGSPTKYREVLAVLSTGGGDVPNPVFQHEIGIGAGSSRIHDEVRVVADGGKPAIEIAAGSANGFTEASYAEPVETAMDPLLLPWGSVKSQVYAWNGSAFAKTREEAQAPHAGAAPSRASDRRAQPSSPSSLPPAPHKPSADELLDQVYALYRKERHVANDAPRFDFAIDVAEDARPERVLVHGRDLVVFGKGYKGGVGYAFLTLQQFAEPSDIADVTARDLTGDGKAEILVRGVIHAVTAKDDSSGKKKQKGQKRGEPTEPPREPVDREVLLVYAAAPAGFTRVFGVETARTLGAKRLQGSLAFVPTARGMDIEIEPGHAFGFDERSYPWPEDAGPVGGLEPLILPWSGHGPARHRWDGSAFK